MAEAVKRKGWSMVDEYVRRHRWMRRAQDDAMCAMRSQDAGAMEDALIRYRVNREELRSVRRMMVLFAKISGPRRIVAPIRFER